MEEKRNTAKEKMKRNKGFPYKKLNRRENTNTYKGGCGGIIMRVKCPKCGHIQKTKSKLLYITCSSCQKKFPIKENERG